MYSQIKNTFFSFLKIIIFFLWNFSLQLFMHLNLISVELDVLILEFFHVVVRPRIIKTEIWEGFDIFAHIIRERIS